MSDLEIKYLVRSCKLISRNELGQDLAEYAILASLIAIVVMAAVTLVGMTLGTTFNAITAVIAGVAGGGS